MTKQIIATVVEAGGTVSFPYKTGWKQWMGMARITKHEKEYTVDLEGGIKFFNQIDKAIEFYCSEVFIRKNIGLAIRGVAGSGLVEAIDDVGEKELKKLVKQYWNEYFPKYFPDFV